MTTALKSRQTRQRGFSLLEILVAFTILAVTLGILMRIFSQAMFVTVLSRGYDQAAALAEGQINRVGFEIPLEEGVHEGENLDGVAWTIQISPYPLDLETFTPNAIVLYRVVVDVLWRDGGGDTRRLSLTTLRLSDSG